MTYAHILGHDRQKDILRRAVNSDRVAHAYLFEGPEGIGKRLMALSMVRHIFCADGTGCGTCAACRKIDHNNHPDLHFLEPDGTSIKIDQIRNLQKELSFRPLEAPKKVCLIDGADKMNPAAGNALLKTLEEPSGESLMILLSANSEGMLNTIRSRCQRLPFARLPQETIQEVLLDRLGVDEKEAHILSALSEGSFKRALGKNRELFLDKRKTILKAITALSPGSIVPMFDLAQQLVDEKEQLPEILEILLAFYRDLLLYLQERPQKEYVNIDLLEKIQRVASQHSISALLAKLNAVMTAQRQIERNVNRQLAMEVLLMRLAA